MRASTLIIVALVSSCRKPVDKATAGVHQVLLEEVGDFVVAARELEDAAPTKGPWEANDIGAMRRAWRHANMAYERIEALASLFPDLALSIDDRYEAQLRGRADANPFDENYVRGLRAVERILWSDSIPASVTELEKTLPGYGTARVASNTQEATDFKTKLCHQLVVDAERLREQWSSQKPDLAFALDAVYWSIKEQRVEITKAATHDEESAYAQASMAVLRSNVEAARAVYGKIRPLVLERGGLTQTAISTPHSPKSSAGWRAATHCRRRPRLGAASIRPPPISNRLSENFTQRSHARLIPRSRRLPCPPGSGGFSVSTTNRRPDSMVANKIADDLGSQPPYPFNARLYTWTNEGHWTSSSPIMPPSACSFTWQ